MRFTDTFPNDFYEKKLHWKNSHNSHEKTCHGVLHLSEVEKLSSRERRLGK